MEAFRVRNGAGKGLKQHIRGTRFLEKTIKIIKIKILTIYILYTKNEN